MKKFLLLFFALNIQYCPIGEAAIYSDAADNQVILGGYVSSGNASDDVWVGDGTYPFQSAAVTTYASSSSASDAAAGTGCRTILVEGVAGTTLAYQSETVTMNGTANVALTNTYQGINKVTCATSGSGETNAGTILVGAANTALANMPANYGTNQAAVYYVPSDKKSWLLSWGFSVGNSTAASASVQLQMKENGKAWRVIDTVNASEAAGRAESFYGKAIELPPKAQVKLKILGVGDLEAAGTKVSGSLEIGQKR
jgi:hypothetical protein